MPASAAAQRNQLRRVRSRIGDAVREFLRSREGQEFTGSELERHVLERCASTPGSATRVMRELRNEGAVQVELLDRSRSLYRVPQPAGVQGRLFTEESA